MRLTFEVMQNDHIQDFTMVHGNPFNDRDFGYWHRKDAFYVEYVTESGEAKVINFEPSDSEHIELIPDSGDREGCARFAIRLIEEDIEDGDAD